MNDTGRTATGRDDGQSSRPLPTYPGLHPGTGTNDHVHSWEFYGGDVGFACQICGVVKGRG